MTLRLSGENISSTKTLKMGPSAKMTKKVKCEDIEYPIQNGKRRKRKQRDAKRESSDELKNKDSSSCESPGACTTSSLKQMRFSPQLKRHLLKPLRLAISIASTHCGETILSGNHCLNNDENSYNSVSHCRDNSRKRKYVSTSDGCTDCVATNVPNLQDNVVTTVLSSIESRMLSSPGDEIIWNDQLKGGDDGCTSNHLHCKRRNSSLYRPELKPVDGKASQPDTNKKIDYFKEACVDEATSPKCNLTAVLQSHQDVTPPDVFHFRSGFLKCENGRDAKRLLNVVVVNSNHDYDSRNPVSMDETGGSNLNSLCGARRNPDLSVDLMIETPNFARISKEITNRPVVKEESYTERATCTSVNGVSAQDEMESTVTEPTVEVELRYVDNSNTIQKVVNGDESSTKLPQHTFSTYQTFSNMDTLSRTVTNKELERFSPDKVSAFYESDSCCFESDHVALKHSKDYHKLLSTVCILETQFQQCFRDLEVLKDKKEEALRAPIKFVHKLHGKVPMIFPKQQSVPNVPNIDWSKYSTVNGTLNQAPSTVTRKWNKPETRKVKINFETGVPLQASKKLTNRKNNQTQMSRSQTFRVAWTVDEQRKLEDLLVKYPHEDTVFNRYRKIAAELENRTPLQVQSRCQKFFIKLAKAGLPVPGHMPRLFRHKEPGSINRNKKAKTHPQQHLARMSTFFPTFHCPVKMEEGKTSTSRKIECRPTQEVHTTSAPDIDAGRCSEEHLQRLTVLDDGRQDESTRQCNMCSCDPIHGVRYHCTDCPTEEVNVCRSCFERKGKFESETHKATHRLKPVLKAQDFVDDDYTKFVSGCGEYNYLDTNFLPTT